MRIKIRLWDIQLVTIVSTLAPLTKITKKIRDGIINSDRNINNQLNLFLFVYVNKYSYSMRCILWNI